MSRGIYFQVITIGVAPGLNDRGEFVVTTYQSLSVGPAGVVGITYNFATGEWTPVAGAGVGSITGLPGPTTSLWIDLVSGEMNVTFGGGWSDLFEIGCWEAWPLDNMDFPNPSDWLFDPLVVDLNGDGIEITELSRSNVFMDSGGDGLLHRTAWAGTGDGVLFVDVNGDNRIGEQREYVFTEWDPTAASDLAALRSVFDTNGDGKLTAADQGFAQFKVMVTNADGSQTARTLAELGITEISLIGDATHITLPDGTVISEAYEADDDACTRTADPHLRLAA